MAEYSTTFSRIEILYQISEEAGKKQGMMWNLELDKVSEAEEH